MCTGKKNEKQQEQEKICRTWVHAIEDCAAAQSPNYMAYNYVKRKST